MLGYLKSLSNFAFQSALQMSNTDQQLEHIAEMRALMERSTRFLSLSGLSGVWAGFCALIGSVAMYGYLGVGPLAGTRKNYYDLVLETRKWGLGYESVLVLLAILVLAAALAGGVFFTTRKARQRGERVWDASSRRLLWAMMTPLATGGFFSLILLQQGYVYLLAPCTLLFYGLALVSGSKYTLRDVAYLGYLEIMLGLVGAAVPTYGFLLWAIGFGVLHIIYGSWMYWKYERK